MNILFYDMGSYTYNDIIYYLQKAGHTCKTVYYHFPDRFQDEFFCERFSQYLKDDHYDAVISINFFPLVARVCHEFQIKYLSWSYDSPLAANLQDYFSYDTSYIFLFDRLEAAEYQAKGYKNVYHLPLAVNTVRLDQLHFTPQQIAAYQADISFVGQLYDSPLKVLLYTANDYVRGYIEGILQAQLRIYGYNFLDDVITDDILAQLNSTLQSDGHSTVALNRKGLSYAIASHITHLERSFLLEQLGQLYNTHFYTAKKCNFATPVKVRGPIKYHTEMPCVFRHSRLNLNPTLKSIPSGIPLRALDIMGAKGVLFSNYQPELTEYFQDGTDLILYGSIDEAFDKADYYLKHTEALSDIAQNGYEKVKAHFKYDDRIQQMFAIAGLR